MVDINIELRQLWDAALKAQGITASYQQAPDDKSDTPYVVFGSMNSTYDGTMNSQDVTAQVTITIRSFSLKYNDGEAVADIANKIFENIIPTEKSTLVSTKFQIINTFLVSSIEQGYTINNTRNYLDRILIFEHQIFFN